MHRDESDAGGFRAVRESRCIDRSMVPSEPHFQRDRRIHGSDRGFNQAKRMVQIAHQSRAARASGNITSRATHIDIDYVSPLPNRDARAFSHPTRFARRELHHMGTRRGLCDP
jgi:hypothetical protein